KVVETSVRITYKDDPEHAISVMRGVLEGYAEICKNPAPQVGIETFADSAINIGMRYWVPTKQYKTLLYHVTRGIHKALAYAGNSIPFPQRDLHLISPGETETIRAAVEG